MSESRRSSIDSPQTPTGPASASTLVLLPDPDAHDPYDLDLDLDGDGDESDDECDSQLELKKLSIPPLPPSLVFLYLSLPYLKLGTLYIPGGATSLWCGLATLVLAASLSAFCRHLWFMLGRYLRRATLDDILIESFVRGRGQGRKHSFARSVTNSVIALNRILLVAMYLQESIDCLLVFVPEATLSYPRLSISAFLGFLVLVFSIPHSIAAKPVIYASSLSAASYVALLVAMSHALATGAYQPDPSWSPRGILWNEYSSIVFGCTTILTVPLSASLARTAKATSVDKDRGASLFRLLNVSSTALATLPVLPLVIFASLRGSLGTSEAPTHLLIPIFRAGALLLSIPSVILSTPSPQLPHMLYRCCPVNPARLFTTLSVVLLSLVPPFLAGILRDLVLLLACSGTFLLPALAHITVHYFRRPLTIVVPQAPRSAGATPRASDAESGSRPSLDPLLQRKERHLQRRRLYKRILWDVGIWLLLVPFCTGALIWAAGRLTREW